VLVYNTTTVCESVGIAVFAATAALWCAVSVKGAFVGFGASLIMGVAVTAMHYTGMAALSVEIQSHVPETAVAGSAPAAMLAPLLIGPVVFLFLAGVVVALDPPGAMTAVVPEPAPDPGAFGDGFRSPGRPGVRPGVQPGVWPGVRPGGEPGVPPGGQPGGTSSGSRHRVRKSQR
jgi:hypothetical protein